MSTVLNKVLSVVVVLCGLVAYCGDSAYAKHKPKSSLVVFGDSISDAGNAFLATQNRVPFPIPPSPPHFDGRFSNGPVWIEVFAALLGESVEPSLSGGNNFAVGGAMTNGEAIPDLGPEFGLLGQVEAYLARGVSKKALHVVLIGSNDIIFGILSGDPDIVAKVHLAADNVQAGVESLIKAGAKRFFVPSIPDISVTPLIQLQGNPGLTAFVSGLSALFNAVVAQKLSDLEKKYPSVEIESYDLLSLSHRLVAHGADFGFTQVQFPCYTGDLFYFTIGAVCPDPSGFLFWDMIHPTEEGHRVIAQAFACALLPKQKHKPSCALFR